MQGTNIRKNCPEAKPKRAPAVKFLVVSWSRQVTWLRIRYCQVPIMRPVPVAISRGGADWAALGTNTPLRQEQSTQRWTGGPVRWRAWRGRQNLDAGAVIGLIKGNRMSMHTQLSTTSSTETLPRRVHSFASLTQISTTALLDYDPRVVLAPPAALCSLSQVLLDFLHWTSSGCPT